MIRKIAIKELTELARVPLLRAATAAYFALLVFALLAHGWLQFRAARDAESVAKASRLTWINQGNKSPHAAAHFGILAVPPRPALAMIDPGTLPFVGQVAHLQAHQSAWFTHAPVNSQSSLLRFAYLTPAFCLQVLFPLLLILLLHTIYSREREAGMERLLDALGVNRATLFFGKIAGTAAAVTALAIAALGLTILAFAVLGGGTPEDFSSLLLLASLYLLYFGAFYWLIFIVSALTRTSNAALGTLLTLWILLCIVAPRWAADQSRRAYISPSGIEYARIQTVDTERGVAPDFPPRAQRFDATLQMMLTSLQVGRREELPVSFPSLFLMSEEEVTSLIGERRLMPLIDLTKAQTTRLRDASTLSPLVAIQTLSQILCGSDFEQRLAVTESTETYRRRALRILNRSQTSLSKESGPSFEAGKTLWDSINPYGVTLPAQMSKLQEESRQIVVLLCWMLAAALIAFAATLVLPRRSA